jgi:hypothetical protein
LNRNQVALSHHHNRKLLRHINLKLLRHINLNSNEARLAF